MDMKYVYMRLAVSIFPFPVLTGLIEYSRSLGKLFSPILCYFDDVNVGNGDVV